MVTRIKGKLKRTLGATKPLDIFLYLSGTWEMTVPRFYYYVNVILKNDPKLFQDFKIWFLKINTFLKFDEGVLDTENQLVRM